MARQLQPLYLLADSRLLFAKRQGRLFLEAALDGLARGKSVRAAYVGASNGDRPEFYEIFQAAVDAVGITDRRMIDSSFASTDRAYLARAHLMVLAGGDVRLGWNTFERTGMKEAILDRYAEGAVLVGISAGAIQLGRFGIATTPQSRETDVFDVFNLVPRVIDTHDEQADWARLRRAIHLLDGTVSGLGIPAGGGVIVRPDSTIEPVGRPAHEFGFDGAGVRHSLLPAEVQF